MKIVGEILLWLVTIIVLGLMFKGLCDYGIRPWHEGDGFDAIIPGYFANSPTKELAVDDAPVYVKLIRLTVGFAFLSSVVLALCRIGMWFDQTRRNE